MRNNSIFTFVLYGLIGLLVILAGYKACQMKAEYAAKEKAKDAYLDETLKKVPYIDPDSTVRQSAFISDSAAVTPEGIEYEKTAESNNKPTPAKPAPAVEKSGSAASSASAKPKSSPPPATSVKPKTNTATEKALTSTPAQTKTKSPAPGGKFMVVTGAFKSIENARDEMESLIKMGYSNAEVESLAPGYFHCIANRNSDKSAALKTADNLKTKGFSKAYVRAAN